MSRQMNIYGVLAVYLLLSATLSAFFWGGYHTISPTLFLIGLFVSSVVCVWGSTMMQKRDVLLLVPVTLIIAFVDEYAHTTASIFTYFDGWKPSPLTVFGWGLFIMGILTFARYLHALIPSKLSTRGILRLIPAIISITALVASVGLQSYLSVMSPLLIIVYLSMGAASLYYSSKHSFGWNLSLMVCSVFTGAAMELMGALEGLWSFHSMKPFPVFMALTWSLRIWTIVTVLNLLGTEPFEWSTGLNIAKTA
jgi:hypothetical protein